MLEIKIKVVTNLEMMLPFSENSGVSKFAVPPTGTPAHSRE
jgi:hypothetical protein